MIVQDDDVRAARSQIACGRLPGERWPTRERLADFGQRWPARPPSFVDPDSAVVERGPRALDRTPARPYPDGCVTVDRDRFREGRFEFMKDKTP